MILELYEIVKSLFSNEKGFTEFGPAIWEKSSIQVTWLKLGRLDILAFEADLEKHMKS